MKRFVVVVPSLIGKGKDRIEPVANVCDSHLLSLLRSLVPWTLLQLDKPFGP